MKVFAREAEGIECPACSGYAERVTTTSEERKEFGCFRDAWGECCARAFVCKVCGKRIVGAAEAPEERE